MTARKTLLLVIPLLSSIAVASAVLGAGGNDPRTPGLTAPSVTTADDTPIETTTTSTTAPDVLAAAFEAPPSTEPPHEPAADSDAGEHLPPTPQPTEFALTMPAQPQDGSNGISASDSLAPAPSCAHQCITKGIAYAHGSGVEIVVETSVPVQLFLSIVADLDHDGNYDDYWVESTVFGYTSYSWVIDNLVAGETYHVMAAATDGDQYTSYAWGQFTLP